VVVCSGCVICQVLATRGWLSAGMCTLSVTLGRLADVCGVCVNSVSYFRKVGGCIQGCVICQVLATYMRQGGGCLQGVC